MKEPELFKLMFGDMTAERAVLKVLKSEDHNFGRFRGAWPEMQDGKVRLVVHTRNGAGNRDHFDWIDGQPEEGPECDCTGCVQTYSIPKHPLYAFDEDDEGDRTYANNYFNCPPEYEEAFKSWCEAYDTNVIGLAKIVDELSKNA